jgi:hypothetical protein
MVYIAPPDRHLLVTCDTRSPHSIGVHIRPPSADLLRLVAASHKGVHRRRAYWHRPDGAGVQAIKKMGGTGRSKHGVSGIYWYALKLPYYKCVDFTLPLDDSCSPDHFGYEGASDERPGIPRPRF